MKNFIEVRVPTGRVLINVNLIACLREMGSHQTTIEMTSYIDDNSYYMEVPKSYDELITMIADAQK